MCVIWRQQFRSSNLPFHIIYAFSRKRTWSRVRGRDCTSITGSIGLGWTPFAIESVRILVHFASRVRAATPGDVAAVAEIYNEGIRGRMATFETLERAPDDIRDWFNPRYPFLVAESGELATYGSVLGWVRVSTYRDRDCYAGIGEFSVYVAANARGRRIGDALMGAFVPACESAGFWKLVSRIFPENLPSRTLCARHGFREVGTYEKHAQLDGVWRDVVIVERLIPAPR